MNDYINRNELEEVKMLLAKWKDNLPKNVSEVDFYTVAKRVCNLEIQNRENAKRLLSDFSVGDISFYLVDNDIATAVIVVDDNQNYEVKCFNNQECHQIRCDLKPVSHVRGKGLQHIIIIYSDKNF